MLTIALDIIVNFSMLSKCAISESMAGTTGWNAFFFLLLLGIFYVKLSVINKIDFTIE